jgi:hypothetical protein
MLSAIYADTQLQAPQKKARTIKSLSVQAGNPLLPKSEKAISKVFHL